MSTVQPIALRLRDDSRSRGRQENSARVFLARVFIVSSCLLAVSAAPARGQSPTLTSLPPFVRVTGSFTPADRKPPAPVETMTLSVYGEATGGVPLWQETQKVAVNPDGRFTLLLGLTRPEGLPPELFASGEPRWLAIHVERQGEGEPGRVLLPVATKQEKSWTKGDFKIEIFGAVRLDATYTSARVQGAGMPAFLFPEFAGGFSQHTISLHARNSMVGLLFTGPDIGEFQSGGRISAVFFDNTNVFADNNGFLLTQAYGELLNEKWRFAAGLQLDVFAPNLPTVLPFSADGAPVGNTIKGQIRVERYLQLGSDSQLTLQGALSEPLNSIKTPDISVDEDNGLPNFEGRIAFGLGKPSHLGLLTQRPVEVGVSGVGGQLRRTSLPSEPARRVVSTTWGVNVDFRVNLVDRYGFKGEVYTGEGLGQMGGGILQTLDAVTWEAIASTGGWLEGYVYLTPDLHNHTGIIVDEPDNNDITALPNTLFGRTYNRVFFNTLLWDLGGENKKFRIGLEFNFRKTEYKDLTATGRLPNDGFGIHPQFQWLF
jgi:hypothetical protein